MTYTSDVHITSAAFRPRAYHILTSHPNTNISKPQPSDWVPTVYSAFADNDPNSNGNLTWIVVFPTLFSLDWLYLYLHIKQLELHKNSPYYYFLLECSSSILYGAKFSTSCVSFLFPKHSVSLSPHLATYSSYSILFFH